MDASRDFADLFRAFNAGRVKYLIVGSQAVAFHAEPRFTKDMDVLVPAELNQPATVYRALSRFGAPLTGVEPKDFADPLTVYQIGVPPVRVDILTGLPGLDSVKAWNNRTETRYGSVKVNVMGLDELIEAKRRAGRPLDRVDLGRLLRIRRRRSGRL